MRKEVALDMYASLIEQSRFFKNFMSPDDPSVISP